MQCLCFVVDRSKPAACGVHLYSAGSGRAAEQCSLLQTPTPQVPIVPLSHLDQLRDHRLQLPHANTWVLYSEAQRTYRRQGGSITPRAQDPRPRKAHRKEEQNKRPETTALTTRYMVNLSDSGVWGGILPFDPRWSFVPVTVVGLIHPSSPQSINGNLELRATEIGFSQHRRPQEPNQDLF